MKWLAKLILRLSGWTIDFNIPKEAQRSVMIAAPHTSNWDALYTRLAFYVLGIPVKIAIKDYWTRFPFSLVIVPMGGLGINRRPKKAGEQRVSQTDQMAAFFDQFERIALVIAPEGSRSLRKEWKMGFYYTAQKANVPITFGYLDYGTMTAGVGGPVFPGEDMEADMRKIMAFYESKKGKFPEKFSLDERYS